MHTEKCKYNNNNNNTCMYAPKQMHTHLSVCLELVLQPHTEELTMP